MNKVNSKAILVWEIGRNVSLPEDVRQRFLRRFAHQINREGQLVLKCDQFRDQLRNISQCLNKLEHQLEEVRMPAVPRKRTRPSKHAERRRIEAKRRRGALKRNRYLTDD